LSTRPPSFVDEVWTACSKSPSQLGNTWISGFQSRRSATYICSCPEGPRTTTDPGGACIAKSHSVLAQDGMGQNGERRFLWAFLIPGARTPAGTRPASGPNHGVEPQPLPSPRDAPRSAVRVRPNEGPHSARIPYHTVSGGVPGLCETSWIARGALGAGGRNRPKLVDKGASRGPPPARTFRLARRGPGPPGANRSVLASTVEPGACVRLDGTLGRGRRFLRALRFPALSSEA
jgi:hypothetical protein